MKVKVSRKAHFNAAHRLFRADWSFEKNDAVFFHDELVLHGRNSYFATEKGQRSLIKGTILLKELAIS